MTLSGQLLRFLSIATVWVAVLFVPAIAEAHAGHAHGIQHQAHHSVSIHAAAVQAIAAENFAVSEVSRNASLAVASRDAQFIGQIFTESKNLLKSASDSHGCVKGCCSDCMICCSVVFTSGSPDLTPVMRSIRVRLVNLLRVRGIEPDALRKPPRNFV